MASGGGSVLADARRLLGELTQAVEHLSPASWGDDEVVEAVGVFSTIKDLAAHAELLGTAVVAERSLWVSSGEPSAAHWLSRVAGVGLGEARDVVSTASRLAAVPDVDAAARAGELSRAECVAVADAGAVNPSAVPGLLAAVGTESTGELRDRCLAAKAAGRDPEAQHRALHRQRSLRTRTDPEGAFCLTWRDTPERGARFMAVLEPLASRAVREARRAGRDELADAHAADAVVAMAEAAAAAAASAPRADRGAGADRRGHTGRRSPVPTKVIVRVDLPALLRGHPIDGETCEIPGYGPVPVSVIRQWLPEALLAVVCTRGVDVCAVTHLGRRATAHQRTALEWLQPRCAARGCNRRARLEIDHRDEWARTRHTRLDELDHLCDHHHRRKTRDGWALVEGRGRRPMVPPGHPDHPERARPRAARGSPIAA